MEEGEQKCVRKFNSKVNNVCPLNRECLAKDVIDKAKIVNGNVIKYSIKAAEDEWKKQFYNHSMSLNSKNYENNTAHSTFFWSRGWKWKGDHKNKMENIDNGQDLQEERCEI